MGHHARIERNPHGVTGAFISKNPKIHEGFMISSGMQMTCGSCPDEQYTSVFCLQSYQAIPSFSEKWSPCSPLLIFGSLVACTNVFLCSHMRVELSNRVRPTCCKNSVVAVFWADFSGGEEQIICLLAPYNNLSLCLINVDSPGTSLVVHIDLLYFEDLACHQKEISELSSRDLSHFSENYKCK